MFPYERFLGYNLSSIRANCLQPRAIINYLMNQLNNKNRFFPNLFGRTDTFPWNRLLVSSLIHVDDVHLYYNMLSFYYKGTNLELSMGSLSFFLLCCYSLVASHSLLVLFAYIMGSILLLDPSISGIDSCAVGFSAVIFCLKYVWNQCSDGRSSVMGISVPTKYAAWVELILISVIR